MRRSAMMSFLLELASALVVASKDLSPTTCSSDVGIFHPVGNSNVVGLRVDLLLRMKRK